MFTGTNFKTKNVICSPYFFNLIAEYSTNVVFVSFTLSIFLFQKLKFNYNNVYFKTINKPNKNAYSLSLGKKAD